MDHPIKGYALLSALSTCLINLISSEEEVPTSACVRAAPAACSLLPEDSASDQRRRHRRAAVVPSLALSWVGKGLLQSRVHLA